MTTPTADGPRTEVWLVRHGPTEWSVSGQHTSVTDLALTEDGVAVAKTLGDRLAECDFDLVLTSPLQRARHTAELAGFPGAEVDVDLVEWSYGDYEGLTNEEIRRTVPGWTVWTHPVPNGESAEEVTQRLDRALTRVRQHASVLVFGHGHCLRALGSRWLGQPVTFGRCLKLDTASLSVLGHDRESPALVRWNS